MGRGRSERTSRSSGSSAPSEATPLPVERQIALLRTWLPLDAESVTGWVCEIHPDKPPPHDDCPGLGMPAPAEPPAAEEPASSPPEDRDLSQEGRLSRFDNQHPTGSPSELSLAACQ
jgi:hypothetical protein